MTRFLSSLAFCTFLLLAGAFLMAASSTAKQDLISELLAMPAPPPPNPLVRMPGMTPEQAADKRNPPSDEAPIEELLEYWRMQSRTFQATGYNIVPSPRALDRIRAEIEKDPTTIHEYISLMRDSREGVDFVKRIYDDWTGDGGEGEGKASLKRWLSMNSSYFSAEVARTANRAGDRNEYVTNQDEVLALAKHDWDAVRPTVDRMYGDASQPVSRVLAMWALYRHSIAENSISDTDRYRDELKAVVEDKKAGPGMRDLAMDALVVEKEWSGRDEWYYSLLEDETLGELKVNGGLYTGLTTLINQSPPDKYADKMIELVKSTNPAVRAAAARNLGVILDRERPDVVRALLPWLEDPKWTKDVANTRQRLVVILQSVKIPESVPGLMAVLEEKEIENFSVRNVPGYGAANAANAAANAMASAANAISSAANAANSWSNSSVRNIALPGYPLRSQAIIALGMQGDIRAAPALRRILRQTEGYERSTLVKALLLCKGFTVIEQADALETTARNIKEGKNLSIVSSNVAANAYPPDWEPEYRGPVTAANRMYQPFPNIDPFDIKLLLAGHLLTIEEPGDPLVREIVARIGTLEKNEPAISETLRSLLLNWKGAAINALFLKDLKDGKSSSVEVLKLLSVRKELREKQQGDIFDIRTGNQTAAGIAACLLESEPDYSAILAAESIEAKAAMFACARLIRAKLPVREAAKYVSSKDKRLALAAELYLESEDSPEARSIVLSLHPNEAKILGATTAFWPANDRPAPFPQLFTLFTSVGDMFAGGGNIYSLYGSNTFNDLEKRLQNEIKQSGELAGVYSYTDNFVRIYKDKAVYSWEEDESRYRERALDKEEFDELTGYLTHHKVDELAPFLSCGGGCESKQLLMLGKQGGRRVFVNSTRTPEFFTGLDAIFKNMRVAPAKLRYTLEKEVSGLEILFADQDKSATAVWKNGGDLRLLVADNVKRKQIDREIEQAVETSAETEGEEDEAPPNAKVWEIKQKREYENYGWFRFESGRLGESVAQPEQAAYLPVRDNFAVQPSTEQWKGKTAGIEIRGDSGGLHKIAGGVMTRIRIGNYASPVVTANARWAIATKYSGDDGPVLVRVNLLTNKEIPVVSMMYPAEQAIAFVPSLNKVLVTTMGYEGEEYEEVDTSGRTYYLLDPDTGVVVPAAGEVRPLGQQTFRPLQPAASPFEFWAAIYDGTKNVTNVGIYNSRTLAFKPTLALPKIEFGSMDMWVDGPAGKIYFVYSGHLLSLPLQPLPESGKKTAFVRPG